MALQRNDLMSHRYIIYKMVIGGRLHYALKEVQIRLNVGLEKGVQIREDMSKRNIECVGRILCLLVSDNPKGRAAFVYRPEAHELRR